MTCTLKTNFVFIIFFVAVFM